MKVILVRHGERQHTEPECEDPLTPTGELQAKNLAASLQAAGDIPTVILTSEYRHAQQTAAILGNALNSSAPIIILHSLTPAEPHYQGVGQHAYAQAMWNELSSKGVPRPKDDATVIAVLHWPRQVQLALDLQGQNPRTYNTRPMPLHGRAVSVSI